MLSVKRIVGNSLFLSVSVGIILTILFALFWDSPIKKYNVEVDPYFSESVINQHHWFAGDFNDDGNSEQIKCGYGQGSERLDITYFDKDGLLVDQYHIFDSEWNYKFEPAVYDINGDAKSELLFFTERNDSIFLNAFNIVEAKLIIDHLFFREIERKRDDYSYVGEFFDFADYNSDGVKELYFWFDAGFGLYPRGIFKMELPSLKIVSTNTEYMAVRPEFAYDITGDGIPELFTRSYAPSNVSQFEKYGDTLSYITVLNSDLEFLFDPIAFPGEYSYVYCRPDLNNDSIFYALFNSRGSNSKPISLYVLNNKGEILNEKHWNRIKHPESMSFGLIVNDNSTYLFCNRMGLFKLNEKLSGLPDVMEPTNSNLEVPVLSYDFNNDGFEELISVDQRKNFIIYDETVNETVSFELPVSISYKLNIYPFYRDSKLIKYMVNTGAGFFYFRYQKNPHFYTLYLIFLLVFLLSSLALWLILFLQRRNIERKWNTEKQLSELQFNSVKNQLNPHFLFNALNSVALMINEGKRDEAYDFLSVNSRMIQRVMNDAGSITRSLAAEIQFTMDYINIQKQRFKNRFVSSIEIAEDVELDFEVPKMCLHTYVENAIRHGFRNTDSGGMLQIKIKALKNGVELHISDNGMGRKAASRYNDSSGNGIKIMNEFYQLFEKYYAYNIDCRIADGFSPKGKIEGTIVDLEIQKK